MCVQEAAAVEHWARSSPLGCFHQCCERRHYIMHHCRCQVTEQGRDEMTSLFIAGLTRNQNWEAKRALQTQTQSERVGRSPNMTATFPSWRPTNRKCTQVRWVHSCVQLCCITQPPLMSYIQSLVIISESRHNWPSFL